MLVVGTGSDNISPSKTLMNAKQSTGELTTSFSVSKSLASLLLGIVVATGAICMTARSMCAAENVQYRFRFSPTFGKIAINGTDQPLSIQPFSFTLSSDHFIEPGTFAVNPFSITDGVHIWNVDSGIACNAAAGSGIAGIFTFLSGTAQMTDCTTGTTAPAGAVFIVSLGIGRPLPTAAGTYIES